MADQKALTAAKKAKKDEFYTQRTDIENELKHYKVHFRGKTVLCNCDDPRESEFFKYFAENFEHLGLKRLIATCYKSQDRDLFSLQDSERAICQIYEGVTNGNLRVDDEEIGVRELKGDGDFRSPECVELLKEADIVVTNPPFSLFREYVAQLVQYDKKFLIIGHQNALHYKEIFPLIKDNKMWLGFGFKGNAAHFRSRYEDTAVTGDHREGMIRVSGVVWFTNLEIAKRHETLPLYKRYSAEEFPRYDNYDAIEVSKTADIPPRLRRRHGRAHHLPRQILPRTVRNRGERGHARHSEGARLRERQAALRENLHPEAEMRARRVGEVVATSATLPAGDGSGRDATRVATSVTLPDRRHPSHNSVRTGLDNRSVILFVTVCAKERRHIFDNPAAAACIVRAWEENLEWVVGRYVIMPDHVHFCCAPGAWPMPSFHGWMAKWKAQVSRTFPGRGAFIAPDGSGRGAFIAPGRDEGTRQARPSRRVPPLWQRDCWDTQLRQGESFGAKCDYIRMNPVRAGLVERAEDWPYQGKLCDLEWHDKI